MHEHLLIRPHARLLGPAIAQPAKLLRFIAPEHVLLNQVAHQPVQIAAVLAEVYAQTVRGSVVQTGQKIGQRRKLGKEGLALPLAAGALEELVQPRVGDIFFDQHAAQRGVAPQRPHYVMRIACQAEVVKQP